MSEEKMFNVIPGFLAYAAENKTAVFTDVNNSEWNWFGGRGIKSIRNSSFSELTDSIPFTLNEEKKPAMKEVELFWVWVEREQICIPQTKEAAKEEGHYIIKPWDKFEVPVKKEENEDE